MNRGRYKRRNRRNQRIKTIVIISIISVLILFIIFLSVGLSLSEKTKKDYEIEGDDFDYEETEKKSDREVKNVRAYPLPLLEDGSTFTSRLASIKEDATSVCVSLNKPDGTLLYRSNIASSFTYLSVASDSKNISSYLDDIDGRNLYVTAILYIPTFAETTDDLKADVELSIWGAVICEAIRAGIGDVLIIADGADEEDVQKLSALAERIHITEENAIVGFAIPEAVFEAEKSVTLIDELSKTFDYLAFNASNVEGDGTFIENVESAIADKQLQLIYYNMRVILPRCQSTEELDTLAEVVTKLSVPSWQAVTQ